jgi:histidine triad (HIT) family protein
MTDACIFCNIVKENDPKKILYQNDSLVVFKDINPSAPVHLLVVPKKHIRAVNQLTDADRDIAADMILTGRQMARQHGIAASGYNLLFNVERGGGQVIFHLHLHLMGGWKHRRR